MDNKKLSENELENVTGGTLPDCGEIIPGCWYKEGHSSLPESSYYYCREALGNGRFLLTCLTVGPDARSGGLIGRCLGDIESCGGGLTRIDGCPHADIWINLPDEFKT